MGVVGTALAAAAIGMAAAKDTRPNIVFLLVDDLGHNDVGCECAPLPTNPFPLSLAAPPPGSLSG